MGREGSQKRVKSRRWLAGERWKIITWINILAKWLIFLIIKTLTR